MEQFANNPIGALSGAITSGAVSLVMVSTTGFPSTDTFRLLIDSEIIKVTTVSGSTYTITRGDGGTTAASHADQAAVYGIVTKEALDALVSILASGTEIGTRRKLNITGCLATVTDNSGQSRVDLAINPYGWTTPPTLSNFAWVNQGNATAVDTTRGIYLENLTPPSGHSFSILKMAAPSTPYTITAKMVSTWARSDDFPEIGLCFRESSSGKLIGWCLSQDSNHGVYAAHFGFTNPTTYGSVNGFYESRGSDDYFLRIADDGTNRKYSIGRDGEHFIQLYSETRTTFLTANEVGFYIDSNGTRAQAAHLVSWLQG